MARNKRRKFNNKYKVPNEKADEILALSNKYLISRVNLEYNNWMQAQEYKSLDMELTKLRNVIKDEEDRMKEDPKYIELEDEFNKRKEELMSEQLVRWKEELKNMSQPFNEDIALFKGMFKLAMDEITRRKQEGLLELDNV